MQAGDAGVTADPIRALIGMSTPPAPGAWKMLHRELPVPPDFARQGPLREGSFTSPLHSTYVAAWLGYALGWCFLVCFLTGLLSHEVQSPGSWLPWPASPVWLYRATQGTHVATGIACLPLLLAKLWTVYPRFWEWPPVRTVAHAVERLSLLLLVGGSLLQVATGISNLYQWYWFRFFFTPTHYFTAYVVMGALLVHVGTKIALARDALSSPERDGRVRGPGPRAVLARRLVEATARRRARSASVTNPAPEPDAVRPMAELADAPDWFGPEPDAAPPVKLSGQL